MGVPLVDRSLGCGQQHVVQGDSGPFGAGEQGLDQGEVVDNRTQAVSAPHGGRVVGPPGGDGSDLDSFFAALPACLAHRGPERLAGKGQHGCSGRFPEVFAPSGQSCHAQRVSPFGWLAHGQLVVVGQHAGHDPIGFVGIDHRVLVDDGQDPAIGAHPQQVALEGKLTEIAVAQGHGRAHVAETEAGVGHDDLEFGEIHRDLVESGGVGDVQWHFRVVVDGGVALQHSSHLLAQGVQGVVAPIIRSHPGRERAERQTSQVVFRIGLLEGLDAGGDALLDAHTRQTDIGVGMLLAHLEDLLIAVRAAAENDGPADVEGGHLLDALFYRFEAGAFITWYALE
jgi:hypothetical protein